MQWRLMASTEWALARLPGGRHAYALVQHLARQSSLHEHDGPLDNALWFVKTARRMCGELSGLRIVAIGNGRTPELPLAFLLCGGRVHAMDVARHDSWNLVRQRLSILAERAAELAAAAEFPLEMLRQRLEVAETSADFETACRALCGRCVAPCDTRKLPLDDNSADLVITSRQLQSVPIAELPAVIAETRRVLHPQGTAIHRLRLSDDYAHFDRNRSPLAYLKYSQAEWQQWFCHRLRHQNRLRASQFLSLFHQAGFECRWSGRGIDGASLRSLSQLPLAAEFEGLEPKDLATIDLKVVLQRPTAVIGSGENGDVTPTIMSGGELLVTAS